MHDDSESALTFSSASDPGRHQTDRSGFAKHSRIFPDTSLPNSPALPLKKPSRLAPVLSGNSHSSFATSTASKASVQRLTKLQAEKFGRHIEEQYEILQISETRYCYYIADQRVSAYAHEQLKKATNGKYFLRPAKQEEQKSSVAYVLEFVSHGEVAKVPICYSEQHRSYWFLSGCGLGSEVQREYSGIDLIIKHKHENSFYELQYPFQICLYRPLPLAREHVLPLPDELRVLHRQTNFLHELATEGLTPYYNELVQISLDVDHPLREKSEYILNKINGRNQQGLTPLILAIQSKRYDFVDLLINNQVNVNIVDGDGRSPLHHACQQADPKLIRRLLHANADPHDVNRKTTPDGLYQSHLSAFHYLAMAKHVSERQIKTCAKQLIKYGCPLMPLTKDGKSPFDLAQLYNNTAYQCVKIFANTSQFNSIPLIEVASRSEAKAMLRDLTCSNFFDKIRSRLKQCDKTDCARRNGLFLFYKTRKTRNQPHEDYGLCVYHNKRVFAYAISEEFNASIVHLSGTPYESYYRYSLRTGTPMDDHHQVVVFRSYEELIYNHTKYRGVLPTVLTDFVRKENGEWITVSATDLLLSTNLESAPDEDDANDSDLGEEIDVQLIDRIAPSDIYAAAIIEENHRRLIWHAKVHCDKIGSFAVIIKDYLPKHNVDLYKANRHTQLNNSSPDEETNGGYKFSTRSRLDHQHESKFLLNELKNHPLIVHAFQYDQLSKHDLRIFLEYLPNRDLRSYLTGLNPNSVESSLANAYHWIYQLAQVMGYLTKHKIVHRDLATRNILLRDEKHIKLSDFGLSRLVGVELKGKDCVLSPRWTPPECFARQQIAASSSDVWAFSVVIWEIYAIGALPYESDADLINKADSQQLVSVLRRFLVEQHRRLSKPEHCSVGMYDLMNRCWNDDVNERPRFVDIIDELNEVNLVRGRFVLFTSEERRAWRKAKKHYRSICEPTDGDDSGYIQANDIEHEVI